MYLKCFFETGGRVIVKTVYSPASQCNVEGSGVGISGYVNAFQARYNQAKRHLWGSLDTGYILRRGFINLIAPLWADTVQISSSKSSSFNRDVVVDGAYRYDSPPSSSSSFTIVKKSTSTIASSASSSPLTFTVSKSSPWHREVTNQVPIDKLMSLYYRVLEAHIFVGHFFVLMFFVLPVVPLNGGLFDYPQFDSWFLNLVNAYIWPVYSGGMSVHPFMYRTMWLVGMVRSIWIPVCFILMFYFYQKYHRFIGFERWILQGEDFAVSSLTCNAHHAVFSHKYVSSENKDLRVHRLGKRPLLYSARNWFSFFDLSGAAFSGVLYMLMPMAHAQVSHLWCDKLDYKVAAKPVLNRSFSMEVTATHHSTISIISHNGNNNSIINNNNNINNNTNSMLLSPSHSVAAFLSVEEDMVTTSTRIVDGSSSPVSSTSPSAFAMDRAAALRIECASVGSISSINSDEGYYEEFDSSSELGASTSFSQKC